MRNPGRLRTAATAPVPGLAVRAGHLLQRIADERLRLRHTREHGEDAPAITGWTWTAGVPPSTRSSCSVTLPEDLGWRPLSLRIAGQGW
ncbi:hypothetical protein [Actinocorallia longicatena]|uniref:Uncharacterized protein n=1 Tax=Actinocorallia longicatena TaxID=111803 RepID=A0ABP6PXD8_9ACTN